MPDCRLYDAVKNDDLSFIQDYFKKHQPLIDDVDDGGWTILMSACLYGRLRIVEYLVELGADVDVYYESLGDSPDERGTALTFALQEGHFEVAKYLLKNGADTTKVYYRSEPIDSPFMEYDVIEKDCLTYAEESGDEELLQLLQKQMVL